MTQQTDRTTLSDSVLIAYGVKAASNTSNNVWRRIGEAFQHDEGAGLTLTLNALPPDGRIILLEPNASDDRRLDRQTKRLRKPELVTATRHD